ncbi:MAG: hypothetical protein EU547_00040 [Promethearchaeota archaeon]|nr:MAG: hypothetical protein EU547_00040 [Candidatus Lokiarchaeota archaeon]
MREKEQLIDSKLYFIRIDYNLIRSSSEPNSDPIIQFITLIMNYDISISKEFENMLYKLHCGTPPEILLKNYRTVSNDFNKYLENLIISNFEANPILEKADINSLEDNFKVYLKEITTKLSVIFFIGIFFPIGLCFFLFLLPLNHFLILFFVPIFLLLLNFLFNKFINKNHFLIGMTNQNSEFEANKLKQFLNLIEKFALNLRNNSSPEKAFLDAFNEEKKKLNILKSLLEYDINLFFNCRQDFINTLKTFKKRLNSSRYKLVINTIINMLEEDSYLSSNRILKIIHILKNHEKLQNKLLILIKGERFKTFIYIFLLPIIIGSIGALSPFLSRIINTIISFEDAEIITFNFSVSLLIDIILIYLTLFLSNSITSYYFLSIIYFRNKTLLIILSNILFSLVFILFLTNFFFISI